MAKRTKRTRKVDALDWNNERAEWEQDGFKIVARLVNDDDGDTSWLGVFTATRPAGEEGRDYIKIEGAGRGYQYFEPGNSYAEHYQSLRGMKKWTDTGCKRMARKYVRQDYERLRAYGDLWHFVGIKVKAYREGVELGTGSLWGIESDSGEDYFSEVAHECAAEAIHEANAALGRLGAPIEA